MASCAREPSPPVPAPVVVAPREVRACVAELDQTGVPYTVLAPFGRDDGCGISEPVKLGRVHVGLSRPVTVDCPLALSLAIFDSEILAPLARKHFGQSVASIDHAGAYACRRVDGTNRLSQHARGRAIDVTGFRLADGSCVTVATDWTDAGPKGAFLHELARAACDVFAVVLTPAHDSRHHDHLHLDLAPNRLCGV